MEKEKRVPIERKYALTIEETAELTGIGTKKLYSIVSVNKNAHFLLHIGRRTLIKREAFETFLNQRTDI